MADAEHTANAPGFTPAALASLTAGPKDFELADPGAPGLRLRVTTKGRKVFRWHVSSIGKVVTLGRWTKKQKIGHLTLAEARYWLERLKVAHDSGRLDEELAELARLTHVPKRTSTKDGEQGASKTVQAAAEEFYRVRLVPHRKRPEEAWELLEDKILPVIGHLTFEAIERDMKSAKALCRRVVTNVSATAPGRAAKVLSLLKQFMAWCAEVELDASPAASLTPDGCGVITGDAERYLTSEEIPLFWQALEPTRVVSEVERKDKRTGKIQKYRQSVPVMSRATCAALRLLLLTGVRTGELRLARWEELDLEAGRWTIPVENQKLSKKQARKASAKPFVIDLPPLALELFLELKSMAGDSPFVLPGRPARGDTDSPQPIEEKTLGHAMRSLFKGRSPRLVLPGGSASPHDLRRTFRTLLVEEPMSVPPHVCEKCLNHRLTGILKRYDKSPLTEERRAALARWASRVTELVTPEPPAKVLRFSKARRA